MDVELPSAVPFELAEAPRMAPAVDFLGPHVALGVIQGQIYKQLYSAQASRQSVSQRADIARDITSILTFWRAGVPMDFENCEIMSLSAPVTPSVTQMVLLHFTYIHCLVMVDRHLPNTQFLAFDEFTDLEAGIDPSEGLCITECRKGLHLIEFLPHGDYSCVWYVNPHS